MLKDFCARVKEASAPAINLSETATAPQLFLSCIEQEAVGAQQQELRHHINQVKSLALSSDNNATPKQRKHLIQILGNPHAPESEWLRACTLLGDYVHKPAVQVNSPRVLLVALALSTTFTIYMLSERLMQTPTNTYVPPAPVKVTPPPVAQVPDDIFGPYMAELQRRIKRAWFPPHLTQSNRVILIFNIQKDGQLSNLRLGRGSGIPALDKSALDAVQHAAPFRHLPDRVTDESVPIEFTFDYNAWAAKSPPSDN